MADDKTSSEQPRGRNDSFFDRLKTALEESGNSEVAEKLKPFAAPIPRQSAKEGLETLLQHALVEIEVDTVKSGLQTFVCCSNVEFVKQFSRGKQVKPVKNKSMSMTDPFKTRSKTTLLTWDLLANDFVSINVTRHWEITGTPVVLSIELADLLRKLVSRLYREKRK